MDMQIYFPHLGIHLEQVGKNFSIFGFAIAYYGVVIVIGMLIAMALIMYTAKRFGENPDNYYDVSLLAILIGIVGARAYYVFFAWDMYKDNLKEIFNIRNGGLAIYGGIIFGLITVLLYCHVKKKKFLHMADFLMLGVVFGQIMGRWGNFFNREAFGEYTDGLFAMQLPVSAVRSNEITQTMWDHVQTIGGVQFIQVSPTFLYESLWNLALLMLLLYITYHKKFDGTGILHLPYGLWPRPCLDRSVANGSAAASGTTIAVSQLLSAVVAVGSFVWLARQHFKHRSEGCMVEEKPATPEENNKNVGRSPTEIKNHRKIWAIRPAFWVTDSILSPKMPFFCIFLLCSKQPLFPEKCRKKADFFWFSYCTFHRCGVE